MNWERWDMGSVSSHGIAHLEGSRVAMQFKGSVTHVPGFICYRCTRFVPPAGLRSLRVAVAEHLRASRAVRCEADQVLIVPGSQAALRLAATTLLAPHDRVAIEEP